MHCSIDLGEGAATDPLKADEADALRLFVPTANMHSCKVALIDAAVHAGHDALPISIQAHHANTDLVIKYTRNRAEVPLNMINKLVKDFSDKWSPDLPIVSGLPQIDDGFSEDEFNKEPEALFYLKRSKIKASLSALSKQKFHVSSDPVSEFTACSIMIEACEPIGDELPDRTMLCAKCKHARPDLFN